MDVFGLRDDENPMDLPPEELLKRAQEHPLEPLCQTHAKQLYSELAARGLGPFIHDIHDNPDLVLAQGMDMIRRLQSKPVNIERGPEALQDFATPVNYQPFLMVLVHLMMMGVGNGCSPLACLICQLNTLRTEDGRCACDDPECEAKTPGDIPPFEVFLTRHAEYQAQWARREGLIA